VGSDVDIIVILSDTNLAHEDRYRCYYTDTLPVQADLWVYTRAEWEAFANRSPHLYTKLNDEWMDIGG